MYGGGVKPGEVDKGMPIRATAIRGQLRFWWRLIHRTDSRFYVDGKTDYRKLFQAEREIWGGLGDVEHLCASKVTVRTDTSISKVSFQKKEGSPTYASFSIDKECNLLKVGFEWEMRVDFGSLSAEERKQVENAIRCWGSFGGVGARTRRGFGAVEVEKVNQDGSKNRLYVDQSDANGFKFTMAKNKKVHDEPKAAWNFAIKKLANYRQGAEFGRSSEKGPSQWPEAKNIRALANDTQADGRWFPRAAYGLPIVFKNVLQKNVTLVPVFNDKEMHRMASPLLLRPYKDEHGKWCSVMVLLPVTDVLQRLFLKLKYGNKEVNVMWWPKNPEERQKATSDVIPLRKAFPNGYSKSRQPLLAFKCHFQEEIK
jgi:CRISPR-associated RAMP protein, Cmr1 family